MNTQEFQSWCLKLQLSPTCREVIATIRNSPPSRRVCGRSGNVSGVYPSKKMGLTIQFESHTVELGAIYFMEHDPQVLEFYDQPPPFKICYHSQTGRKIAHYHTPDFFVLRSDGAGWEEWKTLHQLKQLAEKYPSRYQLSDAGLWRCPPGEAHAEPLGLTYSVRTDAELHPVFIQNLSFLEDYLRCNTAVLPSVQQQVRQRVQAEPGITLAALVASVPKVRADDLYILIATEQIYADLSAVPLAQPERVMLYLNQQVKQAIAQDLGAGTTRGLWDLSAPTQLTPNTSLLWDGRLWMLVNLGEEITTVLPETGQPIQLPTEFFLRLLSDGTISIPKAETELSLNQEVCREMEAASTADLAKANYRFQKVQAYLQRQAENYRDVCERTLRSWVKKFRMAEAQYGCGYVGLLPRTAKRGNRTAKAPQESKELLDTFIAEHYETPRQAPAISVYRAYQRACTKRRIPCLSKCTFYSRLKQRRTVEHLKKRQGTKANYARQPWCWELAKSTPRHGDRPLAIAHIDHTQLDIELRSSATGRLLGRPWATLLMDAYSRRILAVYLTFDAPSYRSCMMALRLCVSRFGRFPQTIVVDGGSEFKSVYFDTLLARYGCIKKTRPGGQPRFGSVIERLFGTTNTELIFNLLGNTQAAKQVRQLTKAVDPKRQAVWTLGDLYVFFKEWAYSVYDQSEHEALGTTPRDAYEQGLIQAGEREHRRIPYNEEFMMATRPSTIKGEATVQAGKGIKVNYLYYWSDAFRNPEVERTKVAVRYDPFDVGVAYAYVQGRWVKCISQYYSIFEGRSEKELLLASQEIRQQGKLTRTSPSVSASRLADLIANVQEHETLLLQRLRDLEGKQVQSDLINAEVTTVAPGLQGDKKELVEIRKATAMNAEILLLSNKIAPSPRAKQTEIEVSPVDLSDLPVFGEYR